jgi:hypothetical protein
MEIGPIRDRVEKLARRLEILRGYL